MEFLFLPVFVDDESTLTEEVLSCFRFLKNQGRFTCCCRADQKRLNETAEISKFLTRKTKNENKSQEGWVSNLQHVWKHTNELIVWMKTEKKISFFNLELLNAWSKTSYIYCCFVAILLKLWSLLLLNKLTFPNCFSCVWNKHKISCFLTPLKCS